ncbi:MAG: hypothetical protein ABIJ09_24945 [Pseudomonadota bacterium]
MRTVRSFAIAIAVLCPGALLPLACAAPTPATSCAGDPDCPDGSHCELDPGVCVSDAEADASTEAGPEDR